MTTDAKARIAVLRENQDTFGLTDAETDELIAVASSLAEELADAWHSPPTTRRRPGA